MPDPRFFEKCAPLTLAEVATLADATLADPAGADIHIETVSAPGGQETRALAWAGDAENLANLTARPVTAVLLPEALAEAARSAAPEMQLLFTENPRTAFARIAGRLVRARSEGDWPVADPVTAPAFQKATISRAAIIAADAEIGTGCKIGAGAIIGPGVILGEGCYVGPNAVILNAILGREVRIAAGAVIGESGFGYAAGKEGPVPVPQLGRVFLADHVEIGSNSAVDRGTLGDTKIGARTKIDNFCHIAHNVEMGENCLLAALVGISGSSRIGDRVIMGGQAGVTDHLTIGNDVVLVARAGVMRDIADGEKHAGFPSRPLRQFFKETAILGKMAKK